MYKLFIHFLSYKKCLNSIKKTIKIKMVKIRKINFLDLYMMM